VNDETNDQQSTEGKWCVLELMGHVRLAGYVTEVQLAGFGMLHVAIPNDEGGFWEQHVPPASLYRMTTVAEDIARMVAKDSPGMPVQEYHVRAEIRAKIAQEERESIERAVRRQVAIERSAEDRGLPPEATAVYGDAIAIHTDDDYGSGDEDDEAWREAWRP
jgi:hypothetical protein